MIRTLAFLALMASPVQAQVQAQELDVNPNRVYDCHAITPEGERYPACLGQASNDCQLQPGGQTSQGIAACISSENAVWDEILNREYGLTRDVLRSRDTSDGSDLAGALLTAQRAWIAFRDGECDLTYAMWEGGSVRGIAYANCLMVMTSERSLALRDMRPR